MITIIKEGKIKHQITCHNCNCVFSYNAEDVTKVVTCNYNGRYYTIEGSYTINCPCCYHKITLDDEFTQDEINVMTYIDC